MEKHLICFHPLWAGLSFQSPVWAYAALAAYAAGFHPLWAGLSFQSRQSTGLSRQKCPTLYVSIPFGRVSVFKAHGRAEGILQLKRGCFHPLWAGLSFQRKIDPTRDL